MYIPSITIGWGFGLITQKVHEKAKKVKKKLDSYCISMVYLGVDGG